MTCNADNDSFSVFKVSMFWKLRSYMCDIKLEQRKAWFESISVWKLGRDYHLRLYGCASRCLLEWYNLEKEKRKKLIFEHYEPSSDVKKKVTVCWGHYEKDISDMNIVGVTKKEIPILYSQKWIFPL